MVYLPVLSGPIITLVPVEGQNFTGDIVSLQIEA